MVGTRQMRIKATCHYIDDDDDDNDDDRDDGNENDNETSNYVRVMGKFNPFTYSYYYPGIF
jgi:hypothetical protein